MRIENKSWKIISWILATIFIALGVLNAIYIHHLPAIFYLLLSLFYLPPIGVACQKNLKIRIPVWIKVVAAGFVIWVTLAIGELMELFESYLGY